MPKVKDKTATQEHSENLTLKQLAATSHKDFAAVFSDLKNAFMRDFTTERACRYAGISQETFYVWLKKSEEFAAEIEKAKDNVFNTAHAILVDEMTNKGDKDIAKWYLERREKSRFALRQEVENSGGQELIIKFGYDDAAGLENTPVPETSDREQS